MLSLKKKKKSVDETTELEEISIQEIETKIETPETKEAKKKAQSKKDILLFLRNIATTVLSIWVVFTFVFGLHIQSGEGMYPRIMDGDLMLFYRLDKDYALDDVLVFEHNNKPYALRYIAQSGDVVDITTEGQLKVNGNIQQEEIFYVTKQMESDVVYPYTVPDDSVFLLGDFRTSTEDSRIFGAIPASDVKGSIMTVLRRRGF